MTGRGGTLGAASIDGGGIAGATQRIRRRYNHSSPAGARGWEEVLGTVSEDGSDPALSAEPVLMGSAPLWPTGGSCQSEEKLAMAPENQFMA